MTIDATLATRIADLQGTPYSYDQFTAKLDLLLTDMWQPLILEKQKNQQPGMRSNIFIQDYHLEYTREGMAFPGFNMDVDVAPELDVEFRDSMWNLPGVTVYNNENEGWNGSHFLMFDARSWLSIRAALIVDYFDRTFVSEFAARSKDGCKDRLNAILGHACPGMNLNKLGPLFDAGILGPDQTILIGECLASGAFQPSQISPVFPADMAVP